MPDLTDIRAVKIRRGLYRLEGLLCSCGGELRIERRGHAEFLWETFCVACKSCDCNGWPTLADAVREAPAYFG